MSAASANFESESWKLFLRNFLLLATLLLCPFPLRASDEAKVAELKKWYAEITAQMRAGESAARLQVLNRMLIGAPELAAIFGEDAARLIPGAEIFAHGWHAGAELLAVHSAQVGTGLDADSQLRILDAALKYLPLPGAAHCRATDSFPRNTSDSPFVWASRLWTWVPDLARSPGLLA
jgi:hypothetical protein